MEMVLTAAFGLIIGSFLNVLGLRYHSGLSLSGRSRCQACNRALSPSELIPLVSFIFQGGRCRNCRARVSFQYPLVEAWTAVLFVSFAAAYGLSPVFVISALVFSLYTVIAIYDIRHKVIPDSLSYLAVLLAAVKPIFLSDYSLLDWLSGPILALLFFLVWALSRGQAMGLGDAKLSFSVGVLLGAAEGFSAVIVAFWIGALYGSSMLVINRVYPLLRGVEKFTMKSEIPFAPFIVLGAWLAAILGLDLLHVLPS